MFSLHRQDGGEPKGNIRIHPVWKKKKNSEWRKPREVERWHEKQETRSKSYREKREVRCQIRGWRGGSRKKGKERGEKTRRGVGGEVSGDGEAEKLHFDGGKLNQFCNGGLRAERQIETVMSAAWDYCTCVCACVHVRSFAVTTSILTQGYLHSHCEMVSEWMWINNNTQTQFHSLDWELKCHRHVLTGLWQPVESTQVCLKGVTALKPTNGKKSQSHIGYSLSAVTLCPPLLSSARKKPGQVRVLCSEFTHPEFKMNVLYICQFSAVICVSRGRAQRCKDVKANHFQKHFCKTGWKSIHLSRQPLIQQVLLY